MKTGLNELIVSVFRKHPALNYYQVRDLSSCGLTLAKPQGVGIPRHHKRIVFNVTT